MFMLCKIECYNPLYTGLLSINPSKNTIAVKKMHVQYRYRLIRGIVDVNIWDVLPGNKGNQVTQKIFHAVYGWIKLGKIHHENAIKLLEKNKVT